MCYLEFQTQIQEEDPVEMDVFLVRGGCDVLAEHVEIQNVKM